MATVTTIFTAVTGRTNQVISTSSDPTTAQCIQYLNEYILTLLGICAEEQSDIGRTVGSITTTADDASYTELSDMYATGDYGWVLKTNSRNKIDLKTEKELLDRNPETTNEPDTFYVDGSNNIVLMDTPDGAYTIEIPYWPLPTALTVVGDTVPFNGLFDNLLIEAMTMRIQNRDEYELGFELKWFGFLMDQAKRVIYMRKGRNVKVSL